MKRFLFCTLFLAGFIASAHAQHDPERSRRATALEQEATEAYDKGDLETFTAKLEAALALEPNRPVAKYNLACGYALRNESGKAIEILLELANDGYDYGALQDPDFENLHDAPGWAQLTEKLDGMYPPVTTSTLAYAVEQLDLVPEGIAYDRGTDAFYLGSMRYGNIIKVSQTGEVTPFATVETDFPVSVLGLEIDEKNNHIWAVGTAFSFAKDFLEEFRSQTGVFAFDLKTGKQVESKVFPGGHPAFGFNDLTLTSSGDIYCSGGPLFRFPAGSSIPEQVLPTTVIPECNGICLSPDENTLFVSSRGIVAIDLKTNRWHRLEHADSLIIAGFDGMYFYDNSIVGIQHGRPMWRVSRCYLNSDFTRVDSLRVLEQSNPEIMTAMTGAVVGDELYFVARGPAPEETPAGFTDDLRLYLGKTQIWRTPLDQRLP